MFHDFYNLVMFANIGISPTLLRLSLLRVQVLFLLFLIIVRITWRNQISYLRTNISLANLS